MPHVKSQAASRAKNTPSHAALILSFERHLRADGLEPTTIRHYSGASQHFLNFAEEQGLPSVTDATREHVELWLDSLYSGGYARASVRNRFVGLNIFFKWLLEEGELPRKQNPMEYIKRPKLEETRKDVVAKADLARVFDRLEKDKRWRDCAILAIFYDTGIRETELANTLVENVDLDAGVITLPKTKNHSMRKLAISPECVRYIDRHLRQRRLQPEWLITGHRGKMTGNGLYQVVRGIFEEMGFKALIGPHDLRHTSASHIASEIGEAQMMRLFGWKKPDMARHYTEQVQEQLALDAHRRASPLEGLPRAKKRRGAT